MRKIVLVFVGGFSGTLARYLLAAPLLALARSALPGGQGLPYDILVINLTGALALGLLYGLVERGAAISPDVRLTLGTGFLGAYTTFSSFVVGGDTLIAEGSAATGMAYLLGSIVLGVAAAHGGYLLSGMVSQRHRISRRTLVHARRWWRRAPFSRLVSRAWRAHSPDEWLQRPPGRAGGPPRLPLHAPRRDRAQPCPEKVALCHADDELRSEAAR